MGGWAFRHGVTTHEGKDYGVEVVYSTMRLVTSNPHCVGLMNVEQRNAIDRWRKRQIYCVAIGSVAVLVLLLGIALNLPILFFLGGGVFTVCLASILGVGIVTDRIARTASKSLASDLEKHNDE